MVGMCVREVSLTLVSFTHLILVGMYVAPPMRIGAWLMARVLWQRIEYLFNTNTIIMLPNRYYISAYTDQLEGEKIAKAMNV